jgi:transposase
LAESNRYLQLKVAVIQAGCWSEEAGQLWMARPYSVDLRERVVRAVEAGLSRRAAAAKFEVSVSFVVKLMQRWRAPGTVQPARIGGWKPAALAAHAARVRDMIATEPDLTIAELRTRLAAENIGASRSAIGRFLLATGLTRKKRLSTPPSRTARTSPRRASPGASGSRP